MMYSRWWDQRFGNFGERLSILDLMQLGELDYRLAGLLWLLMEHRTSVLVAAGPIFSGKTTLFHALLDFLPPEAKQVTLRGYYEDFSFLEYSRPQNTYLVSEEISNHSYEYLWEYKAVRTFNLLTQGYRLGGTIHARSAEEAIYVLHKGLGLPLPLLSRLGIIVNLRITAGRDYADEPVRRVSSVDLVLPAPEGLAIQVLAARQYTEKEVEYLGEKALQQALAGKYLLGKCRIYVEIEKKEQFLRQLLKEGKSSHNEVRKAVMDYYISKTQHTIGL